MNNIFDNFDFVQLKDEGFKEDSVRELIVVPLFNALRLKESGCKIHRSKKLHEPFFKLGSKYRPINIFPDYAIERHSKYTFVLDAKSPNKEIETGDGNIAQVFYYAAHP